MSKLNEYRVYKTFDDYRNNTNYYDLKVYKVIHLTAKRKHLLSLKNARETKKGKIFMAVLNGLSFNQASRAFNLSVGRTREIYLDELKRHIRGRDIQIRNVFHARQKKELILEKKKDQQNGNNKENNQKKETGS